MPGMTSGDGAPARFVGRERELDAIIAAAGTTGDGRAGTVLVEAPSGMGASRLIAEAVARLTAPGAGVAVLRAGGLPAWRGAPYAAFRAALDDLLADRPPGDVARLLGSGAELLLPLLPGIAARLDGAPGGPASPERLAERVNEAVRGLLVRLSADMPVLVVVEDVHVLDAASRSLLAFLARTLGGRPIALVGSYQPDALGRGHPLRDTLRAIDAGPRPARHVPLAPLDRATVRELIEAHEGGAPSAPVLLLVAERSRGNPLVAGEVLAARRELTGASLTVPLEQLVVARAARRSPECRRVLRILAVADGPLLPAQLAAVAAAYDAEVGRPAPRSTGTPRGRAASLDGGLTAGIAEAVEHGFVEVLRGEGGATDAATRRFRIRHELLVAALDADLLPGSRRRMHAAVATALDAHPAISGRHWHRAHEARRELVAEMEAAAEAERIGAAADAIVHLEQAIELAGAPVAAGVIDPARELDLLVRAAEAAAGAGDAGRAVAFMESAIARHPNQHDRAARSGLTERLGVFLWAGGDRDGSLAAYERALELLPAPPGVERARLLARISHVRMLEGSFTEAERLAADAIATAEAAGIKARPWLGHATCTLGAVDSWLGRFEAAVDHHRRALAIAEETGGLEDAFRARANLAAAYDLQGLRAAAVDVSRQGIAAAEAVGLEVAHGNILRGNAVDALISLGRWDEAREMAERALDWAPSGLPYVMAALGLAIVETEQRAGEAAARLLGLLFLELENVTDTQYAVPVYQAAASLASWRGDLADAVRAIASAWARVRGTEQWVLAARTAAAAVTVADARARASAERRDVAGVAAARSWADGILAEATTMVEASGAPRDSWVWREVGVDLATARAYRARLAGRDDPDAWAEVAAGWRGVNRPYETARALLGEAEAHLHAGAASGARREGRDEARAPLLQAIEIALALDALPLLRAIVDVAGRSRVALPAAVAQRLAAPPVAEPEAAPAGTAAAARPVAASLTRASDAAASFGLSVRERGVLAEIVAGRTNRAIGERLFISEKTVGVHVGNILAKLGVAGRVEAATVALRLGLVDDLLESTKKPGPRGPGFRGRRGDAA